MSYTMNSKQFAGKIRSIKTTTGKLRDDVQSALIAATYLCIKDSGNATPFQQILDAVGTTSHRQGITMWAELHAPVIVRDGKFQLNKTAFKELDRATIVESFDQYVAETCMDEVKWYEVAKAKNTTVSIFDESKYITYVVNKLDKKGLNLLATMITETIAKYNERIAAVEA